MISQPTPQQLTEVDVARECINVAVATASTVAQAAMATAVVPAAKEHAQLRKNQLPKGLMTKLEGESKKFENVVHKYLRSRSRTDQMQSIVEVMRKDYEEGKLERYPTGTRPFKSNENLRELDFAWSEGMQKDVSITINIKQGSTRREALQILHYAQTMYSQIINAEAAMAHRDAMHVKAKKVEFMSMMKAIIDEAANEHKAREWDLDEPVRPDHLEAINIKVEDLYKQVIDRVEKDVSDKEKEAAKKRLKDKEVDNELLTARPEMLLEGMVKNMVDQVTKKRLRQDEIEDDDGHMGDDKEMIDEDNTQSKQKKSKAMARQFVKAVSDKQKTG